MPWLQQRGFTVFAPFHEETGYFGERERQWMINLRVTDLDELTARLREAGNEVTEPEEHPNGRFARTWDPEGNPIELWEPSPSVRLLETAPSH